MNVRRLVASTAVLVSLALPGCSGDAPTIKRIYPNFSSLRGDEDVRIEGSGFRSDIGYTVYFGTQRASSVMVQDSGVLVATTPGVDSPRQVDVRVVADNGKTFLLKKAFRYIDSSVDMGSYFDGAEGKKLRSRQHQ